MKGSLLQVHPLDIRGTNYILASTLGNRFPMGWIPKTLTRYEPFASGFYSERDVSAELRQIAALGLNNIRVFGSFWAWMVDRARYVQVLDSFTRLCVNNGLSVTYVFWSSTSVTGNMIPLLEKLGALGLIAPPTIGRYPSLLPILASASASGTGLPMPKGEPWNGGAFEEPGRELFDLPLSAWVPPSLANNVRAYVDDVARYYAGPIGRIAFQSFDLFNEPDPIFERHPRQSRSRFGREANLVGFIAATKAVASAAGIRNYADTVGWGGLGSNIKFHGRGGLLPVTYVSSHLYRSPVALRSSIMRNRELARGVGCPYVVSEFWEKRPFSPGPQPLGPHVQVLSEFLVGGQMWGLIESNSFIDGREFDGVVRPARHYWQPGVPVTRSVPWSKRDLTFISTPSVPADLGALRAWARRRVLQPALP